MDHSNPSIREIFSEACELADPIARAEFIARACAGDEARRRRLEELIRAHESAGGFMQDAAEPAPVRPPDLAGETIGRYRLLEKIGEGGCGEVYCAEQQEPIKRRVAIKVIKPGMDTRAIIARFEAEQQALALMEHPHIAKVFDSGATQSGRPFFVMELVPGVRITEFCNRENLATRERLELFIQVCHAIQHAHQKGVIHRDIKPSNILVSLHDGAPVPKVIDFGIAKAIADLQLTEKTVLTQVELLLGTPAYMSPEQACLGGVDIDTRSDIYSLGVLLYELLTGRTPFDGLALWRAGLDTLRKTIRETDPARPSTRLRQLPPAEQDVIAAQRGTEPLKLLSSVRGDLDWIVLKALEKDRARRYESAGAFAVDLRRHLDDEPVGARPPSGWDAFQKLVRRHRAAFFSGLTAAVALVAGLGIATVLFIRERDARRRAVEAEQRQVVLRREADQAREVALARTEESRRQLVLLNVSSGNKLMAAGDYHAALLWFVEAMRLEQGDAAREDIHRRRIAAVLRFAPPLLHVGFLDEFVYNAEFTPDSRRVIATQEHGLASLWEIATGAGLVELVPYSTDLHRFPGPAHPAPVPRGPGGGAGENHVASEADGAPESRARALILKGNSRGLAIHDMTQGTELLTLLAPGTRFSEARLTPDGSRAIAVAHRSSIFRWQSSQPEPLAPLLQWPPLVNHISLSANGRRFAATVGNQPADVVVWDFATGTPERRLARPLGDIFDSELSPDGNLLAIASWDGVARVFDVATGLPIGDTIRHRRGISKSGFSPDGQRLVTASWDTTARLWDPRTGQPLTPWLHHGGYVSVARFSPDGTRLVTGGQDESIRVWDIRTNPPSRLVLAHEDRVAFALFSPDGRHIATGGRDGQLKIWDRATGNLMAAHALPAGAMCGAFRSDGREVAVGCTNGAACIIDVHAAKLTRSIQAHTLPVTSVQFSPDQHRLLTAGTEGRAMLWDARDGRALTPRLEHHGRISHAELSADGRRVVTASDDRTAQIWDAQTGARITPPLEHICRLSWAAFSPDGTRVVTAPTDSTQLPRMAQLWSADSGRALGPGLAHRDGVLFATFSPDGRSIVTTSEDTSAVVWDAATGLAKTPPLPHSSYVMQAVFSPDSHLVLTLATDKTARVWDADSGEPVTPPLPHPASLGGGDWSPDGREVITYGTGPAVYVWDVSPATGPLADLRREAEVLSAQTLRLGLGMAPLSVAEMKERWRSHRPAK